ncbi:aspartate ammonia-lyase [Pseudogracilibacillus auburnensis]|uniref:Aspartate ammonia-lyase n=1 Tax=Pseudogracilibacillus auburnensis TaxID=1494959 RepID=A0A2V3W049_9BACI|nr:aspartate ammonia-lyase [Pseudogracilibacillus auburnensis]MBO1002109.1 aspartate ammonia-lyase [Pseudogracilibacillus auburnensis]PXW87432.1 aspartate ammonia-lyase [Pseudogracilibacillus auburnensis]
MVVNQNRVEEDLLGQKEVPASAYYGIQTVRARENFNITGYTIEPELIVAISLVKKAAALANMEVGSLDHTIGNAIVSAADEVISGNLHDQFIVDPIQGGAGTSVNMNANEVIANRALELIGREKGEYDVIHPNIHVNMAQSTNDAFPTAIHIATLQFIERLEETLKRLSATFFDKGKEFDHVIKMGRTHLQDAVPIRLGQEFQAYGRVLSRDLKRISKLHEGLLEVNLGATAVGTGLNADPSYMRRSVEILRELTGVPFKNAEDLVDATQNTDAYTEVSSALKICMINMSKIANDLRLMSSGPRAGFAEINIPARQPGSSIMPGKINPVICEVVNQVAFQVVGNDQTISMASEAGQFELNVMEPVLIFNLHQSLRMMNQVLDAFRKYCIEGIEANIEVCKAYVDQSIGVITALNPHVGYKIATKVAKEALETGVSVRDIVLRDNILSEVAIDQILDPFEMTRPGIAGEPIPTNK